MAEISRPAWDAWVGVGHEVLRYVQQLEWRIKELETRLSNAGRLHVQEIEQRDKLIAGQQRQINKLTQQLRLAEEKLRTSSSNSSKPPSSDPPSKAKKLERPATGKRRGGQTGHAYHGRALVPVEQVTAVTEHRPSCCARCNASLSGDDPNPLRHQIVEIPMPQAQVYEHRLHRLRCQCGHVTRADLPEGVSGKGFGPGVEATVATLAGGCRLSHRMIVTVMQDLFGVRIGLGSVTRILARASAAVEKAVAAVRQYVRWHEGSKHVDETGWYQRGADGTNEEGKQAWLWPQSVRRQPGFFEVLQVGTECRAEVTLLIEVNGQHLRPGGGESDRNIQRTGSFRAAAFVIRKYCLHGNTTTSKQNDFHMPSSRARKGADSMLGAWAIIALAPCNRSRYTTSSETDDKIFSSKRLEALVCNRRSPRRAARTRSENQQVAGRARHCGEGR